MNVSAYTIAALVGCFACTAAPWVFAEAAPVNIDKHGLALEGYDPVAYFEVGGSKPTKGDKSITAEHAGVTYRFASEANRTRFLENPEQFTPAFGGWCAYAMADGKKVEIDPKRFEVHDGRLFLFYRDWFTDTLKPWQKNRDTLLPRADAEWEQIVEDSGE
ncbi:MAG: YHS domain-containing (seleno)protein [Planctomycetota bacterium]